MSTQTQPSSSNAVSLAPAKPWKILLIDPSADFASYMRKLLQDNAHFELSEWYNSGVGWVNVYHQVKPDFLFVSLELSKRDGLFCVEKAKSIDPQVFIVFMHNYTGAQANTVELKALALGAAAVLQRPFTDERLFTTLKRLAQQKSKVVSVKKLKFA